MRIVVEIRGGCLVAVYADKVTEEIDVRLVDWDNVEFPDDEWPTGEKVPESFANVEDIIVKDLHKGHDGNWQVDPKQFPEIIW